MRQIDNADPILPNHRKIGGGAVVPVPFSGIQKNKERFSGYISLGKLATLNPARASGQGSRTRNSPIGTWQEGQ